MIIVDALDNYVFRDFIRITYIVEFVSNFSDFYYSNSDCFSDLGDCIFTVLGGIDQHLGVNLSEAKCIGVI